MRIALALGSGGARGYTHIGVVEELRERGHELVAIAGTSMGSVIGGLEAAGRLDVFTTWVTAMGQRDIWRLLDPAFMGPGVIKGQRVMERIADMLQGVRIEDLPIPFTAVATDLILGREVWFRRGSLATAIRASIGIPSIFTPVVVADQLLADGALLNPVPVDALLGFPADLTIAVSLSGRRAGDSSTRPVTDAADDGFFSELTGRVRQGVLESDAARNLRHWWSERFPHQVPVVEEAAELPHSPSTPAGGRTVTAKRTAHATEDVVSKPRDLDFGELPRGLRTTEVVARSMETAESLITRFRMAASPPDVLIEFPMDIASTFDFHRATELIERGREKAVKVFDEAGL